MPYDSHNRKKNKKKTKHLIPEAAITDVPMITALVMSNQSDISFNIPCL